MQMFENAVNWVYDLVDTVGMFLDVFVDWLMGIDDLYAEFRDDFNIAED